MDRNVVPDEPEDEDDTSGASVERPDDDARMTFERRGPDEDAIRKNFNFQLIMRHTLTPKPSTTTTTTKRK
jgi:hypothetical protein